MTEYDRTDLADGERLAALANVVTSYVEEQMSRLAANARDGLITAADDVDDREEEDRLLSAMEEVDALVPTVTEHFRAEVIRGLDPRDSLGTDPDSDAQDDDDHLALVETREVDDWVLLRRVLLQQTKETRALEAALWERLAAVAGVPVEIDGSPVSVQGLCLHFQAAMQDTGASRDARAAIYDAFERTVLANLDALVADLDRTLVEDLPAPRSGADGLDGQEAEDEADSPPESPAGATADEPPVGASCAPDGHARAADDRASVDADRVLGAMAGAQRSTVGGGTGDLPDASALEEQLARAVGPAYVALHEAGRRTLKAVAELSHQVMEHPEIEDDVKLRLRLLAPALIMLALRDDEQLRFELETARHDPVTGLLDRAAFEARVAAVLKQAEDGRGPALCLLSVDGFSGIGMRLGHQVAGRLLRGLAGLLSSHAGSTAVCSRLHGDEMAVLLPKARAGAGRRLAQRLLTTLAGSRFALKGEEVELRVSIGVVEPNGAPRQREALMQAADAARTAARHAGGACLRIHGVG